MINILLIRGKLTYNIKYLIDNITIPTFIMREFTQRKEKKNGGYLWMVCIDYPNSRGWNAFDNALKYITDKDKILCLHVKNKSKSSEDLDLMIKQFKEICDKKGIKNCEFAYEDCEDISNNDKSYEYGNCNKYISDKIVQKINQATEWPDFVIMGHNTDYKNSKGNVSPVIEVLLRAYTNIFYYSKH